ncbi:MAG: arginine decarboxylase, pyruvoyl-dependent [Candidatus Latescibacterota bacterium]|nr:MAG: arginine decarboxylase, pyruvoyl-dependent [Candidatus Latescibacterota bacterium]
MHYRPSELFLTRGMGRHRERLTSFELALRDAGIASFNLVSVSSIVPPNCKLIPKRRGLAKLSHGEIVYCVLSRNDTNEPHRLTAAALGVALPKDRSKYGYLSEHHSYGQNWKQASDYAEDLAASMLASTLGIEIDIDRAWDERKEHWKIAGHIVKTTNITQTAMGKDGLWTSVMAAAVFCG